MKNFIYYKHNWIIQWYNFKNESIDSYQKKYNIFYKNNPKKYFKKTFHFTYRKYGIEWVHEWSRSYLIWKTPKKYYFLHFRISTVDKKAKYCCRIFKQNIN